MIPSVAVYVGTVAVIVAPRHATPDGIYYEQESPVVISPISAVRVGAAVKKAFDAFSVRAKDLRDAKRSDWPAFHASGCQSMRQFAAEFESVSVEYLNPSGMFARAEIGLRGDDDFAVSTTFNPQLPDESVGRSVLGVVSRAKRIAV